MLLEIVRSFLGGIYTKGMGALTKTKQMGVSLVILFIFRTVWMQFSTSTNGGTQTPKLGLVKDCSTNGATTGGPHWPHFDRQRDIQRDIYIDRETYI
jgi:hypothetical protein